jgi:hypothetical protein
MNEMIPMKEFVQQRKSEGKEWPKLQDFYTLQFSNLKNFRICSRKLGRKLFIIPEMFERWLDDATKGGV